MSGAASLLACLELGRGTEGAFVGGWVGGWVGKEREISYQVNSFQVHINLELSRII